MDPGSTVVQEVRPSPRERGVGAAPPQQPTLCLERQEAYIRAQGIHLTDMMKPGTAAMVDRRPTRREEGVSRTVPRISSLLRLGRRGPRDSYWVMRQAWSLRPLSCCAATSRCLLG